MKIERVELLHVKMKLVHPFETSYGRKDHVDHLVAAYGKVRRHNFAKSGVETAFWHLLAQAQGKPLAQLLGGTRAEIESGVSIGIEADINYLLKRIEGFLT